MFRSCVLSLLLLLSACAVYAVNSSALSIPPQNMKVLQETLERYRDHLSPGVHVSFSLDHRLEEEAFEITGKGMQIQISGGSVRALFYGLGKLLRDESFRGAEAPERAQRGIYFATHFGNYYDHATEPELREYVVDLALWGCNEIAAWLDLHHFSSLEEPAAQEKIRHLKRIFSAAADCGMHCNLLSILNEGFSSSPVELRADWKGGKNGYRYDLSGHYHVELCPSSPEGLQEILKTRRQVFAAFSDCRIERVTFFCYDQGGCTCDSCAPFGARGLWKIVPGCAALAREYFPGCQVMLSTWRFDSFLEKEREWPELLAKREFWKPWVQSLLFDPENFQKAAALGRKGVPVISFSEISMAGMLPWGGFGANPRPAFLEKEMKQCAGIGFQGILPYSEGIFEDMNKVMLLSWCWKARPMSELLEEYAAFYFGAETKSLCREAAELLEQNLNHTSRVEQEGKRRSAYSAELLDPGKPWRLFYEMPNLQKERAKRALSLVQQCVISDAVAKSWRWRIFLLRATIDVKLAEGMSIDEELSELIRLYHVTDKTIPCLFPSAEPYWRKLFSKPVTEHI